LDVLHPTEENKAIALRFLQAWSATAGPVVDELADPAITVSYTHFPEALRGREAFKKLLSDTLYCFPDLQIHAGDIVAEGDMVALKWTYTGTHENAELFGVAPSGKRVRVSGVTFYRIRGGKVVEESGVVDTIALIRQLGGALARQPQ
jgi:steroid delta-isomerase-like uncharacterized protein